MAPEPLAGVAQELFNAVLAEDVKLSRGKAPTKLPDTEAPGVLAFDLARAYWFEDLGAPVTWFPIWADGFALGGFADHSWCRGLPGESNWEASCPGLERVPGWHASLVALVDTPEAENSVIDFRWVMSDGRCYRPDGADILSIVERRLEPTRRMHNALFSGATTTVRRILRLKGSGFGDVSPLECQVSGSGSN